MPVRLSRATLDKTLVLTGAAIVLVQLILLARSPVQVAVVILGVVMIYMGKWRMVSHLLPDRRIYTPLRGEVDEFMELVRKLNDERARGDFTAAFETGAELRETVERIVAAAGVQPEERLGGGVAAELRRQTMGKS
jgi:hypothetical protein